jgi:hypothetical protein
VTEVTLPLWQLLTLGTTLLLAFLGFAFTAWRLVSAAKDRAHENAVKCANAAATKADDNEKSILRLRAELPLEYVRREDWIRNQTVIEAKLDALAVKLDNGGRCGN